MRRAFGLTAAGAAASCTYLLLIRPRLLRWGTTDDEVAGALPLSRTRISPQHGDHHSLPSGGCLTMDRATWSGPRRLLQL
jgi:hypothetical protein